MLKFQDLLMAEDAKWHWGEGMKYALEGIKMIYIINGAAALSVLTFVGNIKLHSGYLVSAMLVFSFGTLSGAPSMLFAYLTQLYYGNSDALTNDQELSRRQRMLASRWHICTYVSVIVGLLLFLTGASLAAHGLYQLP
jgi:hypothetical protein